MATLTPQGKDKKRLSVAWGRLSHGGASTPGSPRSPSLAANNDLKEKQARRRSHAADLANKQLYRSPKKVMKGGAPILTPTRKSLGGQQTTSAASSLSNTQLSELYGKCIELSTHNKINQKNSWNLNLIDYITDVLDSRHGEVTNFQMASCTLDASVKIFSCRVDSIHADTYKVLGGLSRSGGAAQDSDGDDDGASAKKRRAKSHRSVNTIESNVAALNVKKFDLEFDVDPLFKKTSAAFDEGGARGLLLNHLAVNADSSILFDSLDAMDSVAAGKVKPTSTVPLTDLRGLWEAQAPAFSTAKVCGAFHGFRFTGWAPTTEQEPEEDEEASQRPGSVPLDLNMDVGGSQDYDEDFDDDGDDNGFDPQTYFEDSTDSSPTAALTDASLKFGTAATTSIALAVGAGSDYSYFDQLALKNWAGPSHWRVRSRPQDKAAPAAKAGPTKKKERFLIDFSASLDFASAFKKTRAATTLSQATVQKAEQNLLPEDVHYGVDKLTSLMCKPSCKVKQMGAEASVDTDQQDDDFYDYNNPNDVNNFCPDVGGDGGGDDDDEFDDAPGFNITGWGDMTAMPPSGTQDASMLPGVSPLSLDGNLVAQPRKVEKINIHYEKRAKRVNVKQLKTKIWQKLTANPESVDAGQPAMQKGDQMSTALPFSNLVEEVPKQVPQKMADNLSVPIMFVCLLHLANEKCLKIEDTPALSDLIISQ